MTPEIAVEAPRAQRHPTSFAQRRMWFLHALDPSSPLYNIPCAFRRQSALELPVLQRALDEVVRRHESLRTTFALEDGEPVQLVAPARRQHLAVVDLRRLPEAQRQFEAQRLAFAEARAPFDLERGPLLRTTVLTLDDADQVLLFTLHHIIADGGSLQQLFRELAALEAAFSEGKASPLEELPAQYASYARWQRERLRGPVLEEHLAYWRERLAGAPAIIDLPLDRPRPKVQRFAGATLPVALEPELVDGLRALCQRGQSTMFMVLLSGFFALLNRYTGQTDVVLGTPIALRQKPEFEPLIGLFVNMLVLRADLSDRPSTLDLLSRVRDLTIDAYSHQELPFERLVEELQPERSQSHQPLVQAVVVLQTAMTPDADAPSPAPAAAEARGQAPVPIPSVAKFDLTLSLMEHGRELVGGIEFNTDLFDAATVLQMIERLKHLLRGMAADPTRSISTIPLLTAEERQLLLSGLRPAERTWDSEPTIVGQIWSQAEKTPDEIAIAVDGGGSLTYRALIERAEVVAEALAARGTARGQLIPVCFNRSSELLVALLGILRAGAAYVPLDPEHPAARIELMVRDVGATVALASPDLAGRLPPGLEVLQVTADSPAGAPRRDRPGPSPEDMAYAIFTSGSTGRPKCAANDHGPLLNRLLWMQDAFPLRPGDRILQKTPYTFDVSVWELFWPLMYGATVVFARPGEHGDPAYLAEAISRQAITVLHFVPSMLRTFLEHPLARQCGSLRWVITSGEALPADVVATFHARMNAGLHNLYGPTECAIDVTHWPCAREVPAPVIPIGYPIANVRIYILDPDTLEPVPPGAKGELYIAGRAVGRGYVNRPELTAASFLPDVGSREPGARMYRSGDLARYRADGSIEYLGRADQQVKLRGFRIEAGEVEEALRSAPGVVDAVVTVRSAGGSSEQQLVAHCVPDPEAGRAVRALLRYDREGLLADRIVEDLPNGLVVVARNRSETDFIYQEVFTDKAYLRGGVELRPGSVVLDVGANIGMFALFVGMSCPGARVYSFEPTPETFKLLSMNAGLHAWDVQPRQLALGREAGVARFTYYPHVSILSGRYADVEEERNTILAYERNRGHAGAEIEELVSARLEAEHFECSVKTISQVIADEGLDRVDLLKIDAEKSEHDVLAGISEEDWPKIRQVAVEVHEIGGRLAQVCELLHRHGFEVTVEQETALTGGGVSMVFARRAAPGTAPEAAGPVVPPPLSAARLRDHVRAAVARHLPDYMVPSKIIWLEQLPRLTSGKVDRKSLPPEPAWLGHSAASRTDPPRSPVEVRIAQIWSELLGRGTSFGRHDSFFVLGGHSLLATSVIARIRDVFRVEISLRSFFADPTVAGLAKLVESGDARSTELMETIPRRAARGPEDHAPLSFSQQRLWFLDRFSPGEVAYNIPAVIPVPGTIDVGVLERSLTEIVRRHEILRTSFPFVNEQPVQRISGDPTVRLRRMDVSAMDPKIIDEEVHRLALREVQRPFDLANGPLFRALLIRSAPDRHHLVLTIHHTAADGWSMSVLYRELAAIYEAFARGQPSPLPELPVQFADFATWQRAWMTGEVLERQLSYWRECLTGAPKLLELPADRARPPVQSTRGDLHIFDIDPRVQAELSAIAQKENCTPFMAMLAAYNALLHRLSGARDICVGAPIANRQRPELEGLIGFFVNTIVLRTKWEGDPSFRTLMRATRDVTLGAFAHQDMPFEHLVAELEPERAMDRTPIFQVMLILQNIAGWDSTGLAEESRPVVTGTAKFDLSLYLLPARTGLIGMLEYCVDLFSRETAVCMMKQFCELLAQIVKAPDAPISSLPLLTGDQPAVAALARPPGLDGLSARLDAIAERSPESPAVQRGAVTTTYGELAGKAKQLAARLQRIGLRPGDVVAVAIEPSLELVVALLAANRAGGAYLLVDPEDPPRRVEALIGSRARLLLVSGGGTAAPGEIPALDVSGEADPGQLPERAVGPTDRAALVPVWSGQEPALGELDQQGLTWRLQHSPVQAFAGKRVACATSPVQDAAVSCLATLYHGSCLVLPARDPAVATRALSRTLASAGAEALVVAPDTLRLLAREFARSLEGIQVVVDLLDPVQLERLRTSLPPALFARCRWSLGLAELGAVSVRPSGDAVQLEAETGTSIHALAADGGPVPLGAFGELAFEGPGLAVFDPAKAPILRTGVQAIRSASGEVRLRSAGELLRRSAADVEVALSRAAGGAEAVVTLEEGPADLAGLVVRAPGLTEASIREGLAAWLPPARLPKSIRFTAALPRRPDGSVDLRALLRRALNDVPYTAPRTELEHGIARIWTEALGVERVGIHDDFFTLGGHSLLATHVIARLNVAFGAEIPLRTLFEHPTIEALAKVVDQLAKKEAGAQPPPLVRHADGGPAPLSFAQQRLWFLNRYEPGSPFYNVVGAFPLQGRIDEVALERAVNAVVERHESLRLTFVVVDWEPVQRAEPRVHVPVPVIDLRALPAEQRRVEAERLRDEIAKEPFDLERGPLLRARLVRLEDEAHVLLLSIHHIVADGWSMGLLSRELGFFYAAFAAGQPAVLPELSIQYTDYARWQRAWLTGEVLARQLSFWRRMLAGVPPLLQLPSDRPRPPAQAFHGGLHAGVLDPELLSPLRELSRGERATTFMTLFAAYAALLGRYTGREDIVAGVPIANRRRPELAGLIGYVANTLVLRVPLSGRLTFRELVGRVRAVTLESYEHQDTPFEKLVEELQPDRDASFNPLFQVMFAHQTTADAEGPATDEAGAELARTGAAKFDFTMFLMERPHEISVGVEYNAHLFTGQTVGQLVQHYERLLRRALREPDRPLDELELLAPEDEPVVLAAAAPGALEGPAARDLVAARARRHPERAAVRTALGALTYGELLERSDRCAAALRAGGLKPGAPVGIHVTDPVDELVAMLGVLRAGGACVPLSRYDSLECIRATLGGAGALAVVTARHAPGLFPGAIQLVAMDALPEPPENAAPLGPVDPARPALIAGEGATVTHGALAASLGAEVEDSGLGEGEGTLIADPRPARALHDALAVWLAGGTAILPDAHALEHPAAICQLAEATGAVRAYVSPPLLRQLADPGLAEAFPPGLRELVVDHGVGLRGESIRALQDRLRGGAAFERLVSAGGLPVLRRWPLTSDRPIGRPRPALPVRILDARRRPVPPGLPGEVFVAAPELDGAGASGRWLADGAIQLLARHGARLQVRGHDVDRDLVESVLRAVPGVREVAVACRGQELVAFIQGSHSEAEARLALSEQLPAFMVPGTLVQVARLPRTSSGEVDRDRLPAGAAPARGETVGRTRLERAVAEAFSDALGRDGIGLEEELLALGGRYGEARDIAARLSEELGDRIDPFTVLLHGSIERLTIALTQRDLEDASEAERLLAELEALDDGEVQTLLRRDEA